MAPSRFDAALNGGSDAHIHAIDASSLDKMASMPPDVKDWIADIVVHYV